MGDKAVASPKEYLSETVAIQHSDYRAHQRALLHRACPDIPVTRRQSALPCVSCRISLSSLCRLLWAAASRMCFSLSASASAPARPPPWRIVYGQRCDQARHQRRASSEVIRPMRVMQIVQLRSHRPHCLCPRHTTDPAVARICSGLTPHARAPKARRARMVADGRKFAQSRPLRKEQRTQRTG